MHEFEKVNFQFYYRLMQESVAIWLWEWLVRDRRKTPWLIWQPAVHSLIKPKNKKFNLVWDSSNKLAALFTFLDVSNSIVSNNLFDCVIFRCRAISVCLRRWNRTRRIRRHYRREAIIIILSIVWCFSNQGKILKGCTLLCLIS